MTERSLCPHLEAATLRGDGRRPAADRAPRAHLSSGVLHQLRPTLIWLGDRPPEEERR